MKKVCLLVALAMLLLMTANTAWAGSDSDSSTTATFTLVSGGMTVTSNIGGTLDLGNVPIPISGVNGESTPTAEGETLTIVNQGEAGTWNLTMKLADDFKVTGGGTSSDIPASSLKYTTHTTAGLNPDLITGTVVAHNDSAVGTGGINLITNGTNAFGSSTFTLGSFKMVVVYNGASTYAANDVFEADLVFTLTW
jgi:hypothetical protein